MRFVLVCYAWPLSSRFRCFSQDVAFKRAFVRFCWDLKAPRLCKVYKPGFLSEILILGGLGFGGGGTRCLGRDVGVFVKFAGLWPLG